MVDPGDGGPSVEDLVAAFELLSDETRCRILLSLAALSSPQWSLRGVRFSELREAVDVEDGGRFNYHLSRLEGSLVVKDGDRYQVTYPGYRIAQIVRSLAAADADGVTGSTGECPWCDAATETVCESGFLVVECPEHGTVFDMYIPPAVAEHHGPAAIERYAGKRARWYVELATAGACMECWGTVEARLPVPVAETTIDAPFLDGDEPTVEFACAGCNVTYWLPPGVCVLHHPAVVAFFHEENDRDVLHGAYYDLDIYRYNYPAVEPTDDGLALTIRGEAADLRVELDGSATVVGTERVEAD